MRTWILAVLPLLAACAVDRSALSSDTAARAPTASAPRSGEPARRSAPPLAPARAMPAQELASRMGLSYQDENSHVLLADRGTRVRIWKDSNEVSVAGRVARMPSRTVRQGPNLIVPATMVSYVEREVVAERKRLADPPESFALAPLAPLPPLPVPKPRPALAVAPLALPTPAPTRPREDRGPLPPDPSWARHAEPARDWWWIVIHHSDDRVGNYALYDRLHREEHGWDECGYHFVIGNGSLSGDGQVEVGSRWVKQKHGAHAGRGPHGENDYNEHGIGICLVGDFEHDGPPSGAQMDSLVSLCRWLMVTYHIPLDRVIGHKDCHATACPGRHFPWAELRRRLR